MKRLIVNADDFGYTGGVNRGIVEAHRDGVVTSTTLMANAPAFDDAVRLAREHPTLGVGCHVVLVGGHAVAPHEEIPSLASRDGLLPQTLSGFVVRLSCGAIRSAEIEREIRAQIERLRAAGIEPSHLDTHKHTHAHPVVMAALARVARVTGIRTVRKPFEGFGRAVRSIPRGASSRSARVKMSVAVAASWMSAPAFRRQVRAAGLHTTDYFFGVRATGRLSRHAILAILSALPEGTSELMCHPGIADAELERSPTRLKMERDHERMALLDPVVRGAVREQNIELITFRELH